VSPGDKATLRLAIGLGLAVVVAYGFALAVPFVVCVMSVVVLSRPGPPVPLVKGLVVALVLAGLVAVGIAMVPLLEYYPFAGVLLTAVVLHALFYNGLVGGNPLSPVLVLAFTAIPVAGIGEQALVPALSVTLGTGVVIGVLVSAVSHALFPDSPAAAGESAGKARPEPGAAAWIALRATGIVMPVFVLALTDPSLYLAAVMKTAALGQQSGETDARSAGGELVGATLAGAAIAAGVWAGLSIWPALWMLMLWLVLAALWTGSAMFGVRRTRMQPAFWSNALITAFLLLGPAIEDSASGKSVLEGAVVRTGLFVAVAFYAWRMIRLLERRAVLPRALGVVHRQHEETT
jgi:Protein of unknown function (DUF2955)